MSSEWLYPHSPSYRMENVTVTTKPIDLTSICQKQERFPKRLADACIIFTAENVILESPPSHPKDQKTYVAFVSVGSTVEVCRVYVCASAKTANVPNIVQGATTVNAVERRRLKPINILVERISIPHGELHIFIFVGIILFSRRTAVGLFVTGNVAYCYTATTMTSTSK